MYSRNAASHLCPSCPNLLGASIIQRTSYFALIESSPPLALFCPASMTAQQQLVLSGLAPSNGCYRIWYVGRLSCCVALFCSYSLLRRVDLPIRFRLRLIRWHVLCRSSCCYPPGLEDLLFVRQLQWPWGLWPTAA